MDFIQDVVVSPDGKLALTTGGDRTICLWDLEDMTEVHTFRFEKVDPLRAIFTADSKHILAGTKGNVVYRWTVQK